MIRVGTRSSIVVNALIVAALVTMGMTRWVSAASSSPDEGISQAMAGLAERDVPVESWSLEKSTLAVVLQSASTGTVGTPDDPISLSLTQREAFLAKSRGLDIANLKIQFVNAKGEILFVGDIVMDKTLDTAWSTTDALAEADALEAVRGALAEKADLFGLTLSSTAVNSDSGAREISLKAVAGDARSAGAATASLTLNVYNAVNDTNASKNGQIALAFVDITDEAGAPLLKWVYDAERGTQDWWQAPEMTTDWFETPGPAAPSTSPAGEGAN